MVQFSVTWYNRNDGVENMDYVDLGRRIRKQRTQRGWTQEALAERVNVSTSFVGHVERGTRKARLDTLVALRGHAVVDEWKRQVSAGQTEAVVRALLALHYDPGYAQSTRRNFRQFDRAVPVPLADRSGASLDAACQRILQQLPAGAAA